MTEGKQAERGPCWCVQAAHKPSVPRKPYPLRLCICSVRQRRAPTPSLNNHYLAASLCSLCSHTCGSATKLMREQGTTANPPVGGGGGDGGAGSGNDGTALRHRGGNQSEGATKLSAFTNAGPDTRPLQQVSLEAMCHRGPPCATQHGPAAPASWPPALMASALMA